MEFIHPFGWHIVDAATLDFIRRKLAHFESMTWADILVAGKKQNHTVSRDQLCADAQQRLIAMRLEDVDGLVSLHLSGVSRVWGYLSAGILTLLWWDPEHKVCPSMLRNT
jgi:hypothetical protein